MIPGWGTKILQAAWRSPPKRKIRAGGGALNVGEALTPEPGSRGEEPAGSGIARGVLQVGCPRPTRGGGGARGPTVAGKRGAQALGTTWESGL